MNFFRPLHEYFFGLIGVHQFIFISFSVARPTNNFLMVRPLCNSVAPGSTLKLASLGGVITDV